MPDEPNVPNVPAKSFFRKLGDPKFQRRAREGLHLLIWAGIGLFGITQFRFLEAKDIDVGGFWIALYVGGAACFLALIWTFRAGKPSWVKSWVIPMLINVIWFLFSGTILMFPLMSVVRAMGNGS